MPEDDNIKDKRPESESSDKLGLAEKFSIPGWVKKVVPVFVSLLILYYYFADQDWQKLIDECRNANLWLAFASIAIPQTIIWFCGSLMVERTIVWFHGPFSLWKYFWVRGAMYILMFINTALGQGGKFLYQQKKAKITWTKLLGIGLFRGAMMSWGVSIILIFLTLLLPESQAAKIPIDMRIWWGALLFGPILGIFTWLFWKKEFDPFRIGKYIVVNRDSEFWVAFREATIAQWFLTFATMGPSIIIIWFGHYFLGQAFNVNVPFLEFMVLIPIVMFIMDLPIAVAGFGTTTVAWVTMFGSYDTGQNIAALTLFFPIARAIFRAFLGLISLPTALKEANNIFKKEDDLEPVLGDPLEVSEG